MAHTTTLTTELTDLASTRLLEAGRVMNAMADVYERDAARKGEARELREIGERYTGVGTRLQREAMNGAK